MKRLIGCCLIDSFALWTAIELVPGIHSPEGFIRLLLTIFLFGTMRVVTRPLFVLLSFPLIVITVGPLRLLLNASLILFFARLANSLGLGFAIEGCQSALAGAVTVSAVRLLSTEFIRKGRRKLAFRKELAWIRKVEKYKWREGRQKIPQLSAEEE